jgi:hypothetical protein
MVNDDRCGGDVVVAAVVKVGTTVKLGCDDKSGVAMRRMGYYYNILAITGASSEKRQAFAPYITQRHWRARYHSKQCMEDMEMGVSSVQKRPNSQASWAGSRHYI